MRRISDEDGKDNTEHVMGTKNANLHLKVLGLDPGLLILFSGLALNGVAFIASVFFGHSWPWAILGVLAAGTAVAIRPGRWFVWLAAACSGLMSTLALPP